MHYGFYAGDTSKTIYVRLRDSTTGLAKTGLAYNTSGILLSYTLPLAARAAITPATQTVTGAWSSGGFVEVDATNCKGLYRLDLPNAAIASGAFSIISVQFTGVIEESIEIELFVPKANVTQLLGTAWLTPGTAGTPDVNAKLHGGTAQTGRDIGASVLLSTGTGTGQLDFTSGVVKANLAQILGTALTETAGLLAGGFKKFFNVATPTGTVNSIPDAVAGAAGGLFIAGTNAATTVTTSFTTTFTGNLTGSVGSVTGAVGSVTGAVGSVTGAVGSVTGNVGGNVTGSVGSVVGAVGSVTGLTASDVAAIKAKTDSLTFSVALQVDSNVIDWKGATAPAMTGDAYARLGAPAGASISADIAAAKANLVSLLAIMGSITGTGVNTVLGFFKALLSKVATTPSDIGGTFDPSTDATEAIRDNMGTAQTGDSYARLGAPAGASVSADVAAVKVDTAADLVYATRTVIRGTVGATSPSTTSLTPSALSPAGSSADQFKGRIIVFDNDTTTVALRGQATDVTASSAAALPLLTFTALTTAPVSGDTFSIL